MTAIRESRTTRPTAPRSRRISSDNTAPEEETPASLSFSTPLSALKSHAHLTSVVKNGRRMNRTVSAR